MNEEQINRISALDTERMDGTIQSFLLLPDLENIPFETFAINLIERLYNEKRVLVKDNIRLSKLIERI